MVVEQSLEEVLGHVESLRKDLSAEIVVQEEEGHWEDDIKMWSNVGNSSDGPTGQGYFESFDFPESYPSANPRGGSSYFIDKTRITKPNTEKQAEARQQLQQTYDSSEWYSARYTAGRALGIKDNEPEGRLVSWVDELIKKTKSELVIQEEEGHNVRHEPQGYSGINEDNYIWDEYVVTQQRITEPNPPEIRILAKQDLKILKKELKRNYNNPTISLDERIEVKKALEGMWGKENSELVSVSVGCAIIGGIVAVPIAACAGLGYMIYQYLVK